MIRKESNLSWTLEADNARRDTQSFLKPLFDDLRRREFSLDEIYYIVSCALHEMILQYVINNRNKRYEERD